MDKTFNISVRDRLAKNLSHLDYVCGNTGYMVQFDFDEEWADYPIKTARFIESSGEHHDVAVIDSQCEFPQIMNTIRVEVGVYAGDLYTTTPAVIGARRSILSTGGDRPAVPEKNEYDKMMEVINKDALRAENAANKAEDAAEEAKAAEAGMVVVRLSKPEGKLVSSHSYDDITKAVEDGKAVVLRDYFGYVYTYSYHGKSRNNSSYWSHKFVRQEITNVTNKKGIWEWWYEIASNGHVGGWTATPAKTPNPFKLLLTGAVSAEYDGSADITVEIPQGGGVDEDQLNQAVETALQEAKDSGLFDGADGKDGVDGFSPTVSVSKTGKVTTIHIADKNGTKTATINDGEDGQDAEGGGGTGLPTGGEPHQMLVTDADGNAKWEERTHYSEAEQGVVIDVAAPIALGDGQFSAMDAVQNQPTAGNVYMMTYSDGTTVELDANDCDMDGVQFVGLGNPMFVGGENNGQPLFMLFVPPDMAEGFGGMTVMVATAGQESMLPFSISGTVEKIHKINKKYLPTIGATYLINGSALGSVRNINTYAEDEEYQMGENAFAMNGRARGMDSFAVGGPADAVGDQSFAHAGVATGAVSFAANGSQASGDWSFAANKGKASGRHSAAFGFDAEAKGLQSFAEGHNTIAAGRYQHVQGEYNIEDTANKYAHIVGNGTYAARSNAHTIDWDGNGWFAGTVEGTALILPDTVTGKRYAITVADGKLTMEEVQ